MSKRPKTLEGKTSKYKTGCGSIYITTNWHEGKLYEVRFQLGKSGSCLNSHLYHEQILLSILLQSDIPRAKIIKTLRNHSVHVGCGSPFEIDGERYHSCLDLIGRVLIEELKKEEKEKT